MTIIWNKVTWYSKLLAVVVLAGAIWLGFYFNSEFKKVGDIKPVIVQNTSNVEASNWKSYRSEEYGFEFKYPDNFIIVGPVVPNEIIRMELANYKTDYIQCILTDKSKDNYYRIEDMLEGKYEKTFGKFNKFIINGISAVRFDPQEDLGGDKSQQFYFLNFPRKDQMLGLNCSANPFDAKLKIIEKILSTFKFTK